MPKDTATEITNARNLLFHAIVERADKEGLGVEVMEHLGEQGFREVMDGYRAHEKHLGRS